MGVLTAILTVVLVITCFALIGMILIQRGRGGGLAGAFGGGGVEQAFGTRAATMAQKITAVLAILFLALSVTLGLLHRERSIAMPRMPEGAGTEAGQSEPQAPFPPPFKPEAE